MTNDFELGVQARRHLRFDESRRDEGAQPSGIEPQASPDLEQICGRACRDSACASAQCLQVTKVAATKREQLERGRAIAAAAAVGERPILSHAFGLQRDRHRALRGLRAACMRHAAEGQHMRRFGLQSSLLVLGLDSLTQLSSWDSLGQQRRL